MLGRSLESHRLNPNNEASRIARCGSMATLWMLKNTKILVPMASRSHWGFDKNKDHCEFPLLKGITHVRHKPPCTGPVLDLDNTCKSFLENLFGVRCFSYCLMSGLGPGGLGSWDPLMKGTVTNRWIYIYICCFLSDILSVNIYLANFFFAIRWCTGNSMQRSGVLFLISGTFREIPPQKYPEIISFEIPRKGLKSPKKIFRVF